jgi:hypothetical protein
MLRHPKSCEEVTKENSGITAEQLSKDAKFNVFLK